MMSQTFPMGHRALHAPVWIGRVFGAINRYLTEVGEHRARRELEFAARRCEHTNPGLAEDLRAALRRP